jgi:polyhydroxybutyrate depolymerase
LVRKVRVKRLQFLLYRSTETGRGFMRRCCIVCDIALQKLFASHRYVRSTKERVVKSGAFLLLILVLNLLMIGCFRQAYGNFGGRRSVIQEIRRGSRVREVRKDDSQQGRRVLALQEKSILVDGRTRTFQVYVPRSYTPRIPTALVLAFHGRGGNGNKMAEITHFERFAERDGTIVVYPDGYENTWNDGRGTTKAERAGVDDVAFVKTLIYHLTKEFNIDENRIYAVGVSNGAIFSHRLGCELSDRLAAIATVVGQITPRVVSRCHPIKKISVLGIYGTSDPLNPWEGGKETKGGRGAILSVRETMDLWTRFNGCRRPQERESLPVRVNDGTRVWRERYVGCNEGVEMILYGVEGMGHTWPPRPPAFERMAGKTSGNLDASEVIWNFLMSHSRRSH